MQSYYNFFIYTIYKIKDMIYLKKFNESSTDKEILYDYNIVDKIGNALDKLKIIKTDYLGFFTKNSRIKCYCNESDGYTTLRFKRNDNRLDTFLNYFKERFLNKVEIIDKYSLKIYPEATVDSITDYKEDIEDSLVILEDIGYKIDYNIGRSFINNRDKINFSEIGEKTIYYIEISFKLANSADYIDNGDEDDGDDSVDQSTTYLSKLKRDENFIITKNLHKNIVSVCKRIQSFGLKVVFRYNSFENFELYVLCRKDENFDKIPLIS